MLNEPCRIQITSLIAAMQTYQAKEDSQNSFLNKVHHLAVMMLTKGIPPIHLCLIKKELSNSQWSFTEDCGGFKLIKQRQLLDDSFFMDTILYCYLCHYPLQGPPAW